jgi:hypothetical protein
MISILHRSGVMRLAILAALAAALTALDAADPRDPLARSAPLAPSAAQEAPSDPDERSLRDMERAVRDREARIQEILRRSEGIRPVAAADLGPGLGRPRAERDAALAELRGALAEWLGRTHRADRDLLDAAGPARQTAQVPGISAENRLAIAECLRELALDERVADRDRLLGEGLAELDQLPSELAEHQRPRAAWLRVFFLAEQARTAGDPAAKADLVGRARAAAEAFAAAHADSDLAPAVAALAAGLP